MFLDHARGDAPGAERRLAMIPKGDQYPDAEIVEWQWSATAPSYYRGTNKPIAIVVHVMEGWARTAGEWAKAGYAQASWHFTVARDGTVYQHLSFADGGYHAGIPNTAPRPSWKLWRGSDENVNNYTVGIEHEGFSGQPFSEKQIAASAALARWICDRLNIPADRDRIIGHYEIDRVDRPNDPGPTFPWADYLDQVQGELPMTPDEKAERDLMKIRLTSLEHLLLAKTGNDAVLAANVLNQKGLRPLVERVNTLETGGDSVARTNINGHLQNHGAQPGGVPEHSHEPGKVVRK